MQTIFLVNAGNDASMASIANDYSFPPLNILALATWLQEKLPGVHIVCRDSGIVGKDSVIAEIKAMKPVLVGVGVLATSYRTALELCSASKEVGAYTVLGNDQASHLSQQILRNQPDVDFVIGAEYGEFALEMLVEKLLYDRHDFAAIPSLTFRDSHGDIGGFDYQQHKQTLSILNQNFPGSDSRKGALDIFPIPDRTLYPKSHWDGYLSNYMAAFSHLHPGYTPSGVTTMNRARGCSRANENIKCKHCDMLLDTSFSSAQLFWQEVQQAHRDVNSEIFYEVCDSLTSFSSFINEVTRQKPKDLGFDPKFFIYGQALDIMRNQQLPKALKEIGVFKMNIGLESGCDQTLKHMKGKKDSVEANYYALKKLKELGIHVYGSFVLGTEAETLATLSETVDWVKKIIDENLISDVEAQPILPLPNNYYGKIMFPDGMQSDWPLDIDTVSREYVNKHSNVSYDDCIDAVNTIRAYAKDKDKNFGSGVSKESNYQSIEFTGDYVVHPINKELHKGLCINERTDLL